MGDGEGNIGELVRFDQRCRNINIGYFIGGEREGQRGIPLVAYIDILIRKDLIRFHSDEHAAAEWRLEQSRDILARIIGRFVQADVDMSFVVDGKRTIVASPWTIAVETAAHIRIGAGNGDTQLIIAGSAGHKDIAGILAAHRYEA